MRRCSMYLLILICIGFLTACNVDTVKNTETKASEAMQQETTGSEKIEILSEQDVMALFYQYRDEAKTNVIDCIVVRESDHGILGVVRYTTEGYDGCIFDFLTDEVPLCVGVEAHPTDVDSLEYLGGDTVSCQLVNADGAINTYKVSFYRSDIEYGFKVVSE